MEKQDILVVTLAIVAFAVLVLVVKPVITGQSFGLPPGSTAPDGGTGPTVTPPVRQTPVPTTAPPRGTPSATPSPAVTPGWNGSVKAVGFVGQPEGQVTLPPSPTIPEAGVPVRPLATYAVISNQWPGTTENLYIPTPWWVLEYTADPFALPPNAFPLLVIQVFDAQDPNRFITAPIKQPLFEDTPAEPWSTKFYEGRRTYYFKVDTHFIRSYTLTIKIPREYV